MGAGSTSTEGTSRHGDVVEDRAELLLLAQYASDDSVISERYSTETW